MHDYPAQNLLHRILNSSKRVTVTMITATTKPTTHKMGATTAAAAAAASTPTTMQTTISAALVKCVSLVFFFVNLFRN